MIDLREYFVKNLENKEYYFYKFGYYLDDYEVNEYKFYNDTEIIKEFKKLLYPYNDGKSIDNEKFIYLCFYLYCNNYYIVEYPNFLSTPTNRWDLSYVQIRNSIIEQEGSNTVTWAERRLFIDKITIKKQEDFYISKEINDIIKSISTRSADFNNMAIDEKLKEIVNCIEYLLKKDNGKFKEIDCINSCSFLTNEIITEYRKTLQCFRHSKKESIVERNNFTPKQKKFLVEFGIVILQYIYDNKEVVA